MLKFILKGLLRDRSRSFFPVLIVAAGVMVIVFMASYLDGFVRSMLNQNARFETGHLKIVTNAYAENISQKPYDLGFIDMGSEVENWKKDFPEIRWTPRIYFGALLDVPDAEGETMEQGNVFGLAIDLKDENVVNDFRLQESLVRGRLPQKPYEIILSETLFDKLGLALDSKVTLLGSSFYGAMSFANFSICGTVDFGVEAIDRSGLIADIEDVRTFLDMQDGASEYFGYLPDSEYDDEKVQNIKQQFNAEYNYGDEFAPVMLTLTDQNDLGYLLLYMKFAMALISFVFVIIIGIVLWNAGLMNGIRRYGEFGLRLAMGESKGHLYGWLLIESLVIGIIGSLIGAALSILAILYFNDKGFNFSAILKDTSMMVENVIYTTLHWKNVLLGMLPGIVATILGALLAGLGIFRRKTSQLFKELET